MTLTKEDALKTIDETIDALSYWIPRITNSENKQRRIKYYSVLNQMKMAVLQGSETWQNTEEQLALVDSYASKVMNNLPPIRYGHPLDDDAKTKYTHGMSCSCQWCESKKLNWK